MVRSPGLHQGGTWLPGEEAKCSPPAVDFVGFQLLKTDRVISIEKSVGDSAVWGAGTSPAPIPLWGVS